MYVQPRNDRVGIKCNQINLMVNNRRLNNSKICLKAILVSYLQLGLQADSACMVCRSQVRPEA